MIQAEEQNDVLTTNNGFAIFAELVKNINQTTKTNAKLQSLVDYFMLAPHKDKVWVIALFTGRRPRRVASSSLLRNWCSEIVKIPDWLLEECYHTTGDLAETISLLLPENDIDVKSKINLSFYIEKFISLEKESEAVKKEFITHCWQSMNRDETFVFNKLITGSFRIGVSQKMIVNALAKTIHIPASSIAHRITGKWDPVTTKFEELLGEAANSTDFSKPYPFYLAYALDMEPKDLGEINDWQAEWKWDGIRGQIIKRNDELFVWSRGEELMTEKFPEYQILKELLPNGIALDGEIIPAIDGKPLPFAVLQTRIGRKNISKKQLSEAPIHFFVYDLLEFEGKDCREKQLIERREILEKIVKEVNNSILQISPVIDFDSWNFLASLREKSREMNSEGIML
ncbi:MAG: ATP-dependent DNA ligase, partial [Bacteroidota bacterium]